MKKSAAVTTKPKQLVLFEGKQTYTTTRIIAECCEVRHSAILKLVKKYKKRLDRVGKSKIAMRTFSPVSKKKGGGGRPGVEGLLEEIQTTFLITLMQNSPVVVAFKKQLTRDFFEMRTAVSRLAAAGTQDEQWLDMRKDGTIAPRRKTDTIKQFVEYATQQGSKSAKKYYLALAKMENSALFFLEQRFANVREVLIIRQLMIVSMADDVVEIALRDGMDEGLDYKDCYKLAKERVIIFARLAGRSPILSLELKQ